jgi:hypothetical protein
MKLAMLDRIRFPLGRRARPSPASQPAGDQAAGAAHMLREQVKKGAAVKSVNEVHIEPAEYPKYLEAA